MKCKQDRWLLVGFEKDILLHTIDVLDALLDEPAGVTFLRRALANTRVAKQGSGLALAHHQEWDPVPRAVSASRPFMISILTFNWLFFYLVFEARKGMTIVI